MVEEGGIVVVVVVVVACTGRVVVVVGVGRFTRTTGRARTVVTRTRTVACQATRRPAAGDWATTRTHLLDELPGPVAWKYSCDRRSAASTWAWSIPTRRGITRDAWCATGRRAVVVVRVAWACHATIVPAAGDWATTRVQVSVAAPGPRVTK